jgi:hypothetical protein
MIFDRRLSCTKEIASYQCQLLAKRAKARSTQVRLMSYR